ncbi:MAG: 16S rRNA (cytosine(967)-C(5))-methyltransferase RsmB [Lachnospiraceae bacterium]
MTNDRLIILETLLAIGQEEAYSHLIIKDVLDKYAYLDRQERSFIKRVTEGTLERRIELDYLIDRFSSTKTKKMKPVIRTILEMGVYQLKYMDAVPASAVCNESVKLAEKKGFRTLKGFVNGVLRNIARNLNAVDYPEREEDILTYFSVRYSMPQWIVALFLEERGEEITEKLLQAFLEPRAVTIRTNLSKISVSDLKKCLREEGAQVEQAPYVPYALRLTGTDSIAGLSSFQKGFFQVQDISSMLVCELAGIRSGKNVIDVCAAPGGKALHAADLLDGSGHVEARDLTEIKVSLLKENIQRCGFFNISADVQDARVLTEESIEQADIVLADLPCSGLGIMGRKNDIKYRTSPEKLESLVTLQRNILRMAGSYVKPGGILMFSTCTIHRAENEENVSWIKEHLPFASVSLEDRLPRGIAVLTAAKGYVQLLPGVHDTDGFFIAKFQKKSL